MRETHECGRIRTASTRRTVRRGKKPQWGFFRCAARAIHPRPPRDPVSEPGTGFSVLQKLFSGLGGRIRTAAATSQKTAQKQPGSRNPPAPTHLTAPVCKHTGAVLFLSAQGYSSMQHTFEVEKNGAFVTNLSQKDYKRPFSPRKDCETIVYLVSYRGDWPSVPVCEKK